MWYLSGRNWEYTKELSLFPWAIPPPPPPDFFAFSYVFIETDVRIQDHEMRTWTFLVLVKNQYFTKKTSTLGKGSFSINIDYLMYIAYIVPLVFNETLCIQVATYQVYYPQISRRSDVVLKKYRKITECGHFPIIRP